MKTVQSKFEWAMVEPSSIKEVSMDITIGLPGYSSFRTGVVATDPESARLALLEIIGTVIPASGKEEGERIRAYAANVLARERLK